MAISMRLVATGVPAGQIDEIAASVEETCESALSRGPEPHGNSRKKEECPVFLLFLLPRWLMSGYSQNLFQNLRLRVVR